MSETKLLQDEYIINHQHFKRQLITYIKQRNYAIMFAIFCVVLSFAIVYKSLIIANEGKKIEKIVFKEDGTGGLTYMGIVNNGIQINTKKYIANQLQEYVVAMNSVPISHDMREYNISKVQFMTDVIYWNSLQKNIKDNYLANNGKLVSIKITTVAEISKNIWAIDWTQYVDDANTGSFKSIITFNQVINKNNDTLAMAYNPLDLAITHIENNSRVNL